MTLALVKRLPQAGLSRSLGRIADTPLPRPVRGRVLRTLASLLGVDLTEAEKPVEEYVSVNDFFVRRLRPGIRSWPNDPRVIASPVDGIVGQHGTVTSGRLLQAKGRDYTAAALLDDAEDAGRFAGGSYITLYLSPRHYHRIHAPCSGAIPSARHVPGALLPVNAAGVRHVPDLFPRNERVICNIDGPLGRVSVVAIGAYNVGRISTAFDDEWAGPGRSVANRKGVTAHTRSYEPPKRVRQGDEIMAFHLGSTLVVLCERGPRLVAPPPGSEIRLGAQLLRGDTRA